MFRLVNMLARKKNDQEHIWKIIRQIRKSFLSQNTDPPCDFNNPSLLIDNHIRDNIETMGEKLKLNTTSSRNKNVSDKILQTAAHMFNYLNLCPSTEANALSNFLKDLFKYRSAKNILLALTSIMKSSKDAKKESSTKIFMKAMEIFKLSTYSDIEVITKEKKINEFKHFNKTRKILG